MRVLLALLGLLSFWSPQFAEAQTPAAMYCYQGPTNPQWAPCSPSNQLAVSASVSASITGFNPTTTGTPIAVTTGGVTGTLPAGTVVVATNVGTTNGAYCKLGASATTSDQYIAPNGGWFQFTVAASTQLTCITSTSTTTVNMVGGSGLPTGTGGGGGGSGGGGAVTVANGADIVEGNNTDAASCLSGTSLIACIRALNASMQQTGTVQGGAANGVATAGNPVQGGCVAESAEAPVLAGQAAYAVCDLARKLIVLPYANPENMISCVITTAMTGTTTTSLCPAPGVGFRNYITTFVCGNEHATVGTSVLLQDGSGGTSIGIVPAAPAFGGAAPSLPTPVRQPTLNTALFVQNVTTGASTKCWAVGYKGA